MDCLNAAVYIAMQAGVASLIWGATGVGKTAVLESFAAALGRKIKVILPSQHLPEDIAGMPSVDKEDNCVRMVPQRSFRELTDDGWVLCIDEINTAMSIMKPILLTLLNEGRVGELRLHPNTLRVAIANPPEIAPNSSPLEGSILNRLYHHEWETPFDTWKTGMLTGDFPAPDFPVVGSFHAFLPAWRATIVSLLGCNPARRETKTLPETAKAFPSLRSWDNLSKALAAAEKVGASAQIQEQLADGLVGPDAAAELWRHKASSELHDGNAILEGAAYDTSSRPDQLVWLPVSIMSALRQDSSDKRLTRAATVFVDLAEHGLADVVLPAFGELARNYTDWKMPASLTAKVGKIVASLRK